MKCLEQCVHLEISDELLAQAEKEEKLMWEQKGQNNPTTLLLNKRMHLYGSLAQNGVFEKLAEWNMEVETSPYFSPTMHHDDYDFLYGTDRCDIQGQPLGTFKDGRAITNVFPGSRFLVKNQKEQKPMDYYVFCAIDLPGRLLHIAGVISYAKLWSLDQELTLKNPCHYVTAGQLTGFRRFIFHS